MNRGIFSLRSDTVPANTLGFLGAPQPIPMPDQAIAFDPDAARYLSLVEAADSQPLERAVALAINSFVVGCKGDGLWNAFRATVLLCGARTVAGIAIPLVGPTPTFNNVTAAKYDRAVGVIGNGIDVLINTNRANHIGGANKHLAVWRSSDVTTGAHANGSHYLCSFGATTNTSSGGDSQLSRINNSFIARVNGQTGNVTVTLGGSGINSAGRGFLRNNGSATNSGFFGAVRNPSGTTASASMTVRIGSQNMYLSGNPLSGASTTNIHVFGAPIPTAGKSPARIAFYSVGLFLDLAALSARVEQLITNLDLALNFLNGLTRHSSYSDTGNVGANQSGIHDYSKTPWTSSQNNQA